MLSGETSVGEFPIETVETMARIIESTEDHGLARMAAIDWQPRTRGGVIAKAAAEVAERVGAKYLVAFTQSGDSARRLSRYRGHDPDAGVHARCPVVRSQLALSLGRRDVPRRRRSSTPTRWCRQVDEALLEIGRVRGGRPGRDRRRQPAGHPRLDQRAAHPPDGRRDQRGRAGLPPTAADPLSAWARPARRAGRRPRGWTPRSSSQFDRRHGTSTRSSASPHQPQDLLGHVGELPTGVVVALRLARHQASCPVVHPAPVGVEQPAQEVGRVRLDDRALPLRDAQLPLVLAPGPVLREQARPVLPVLVHDDAAGHLARVRPRPGFTATHRGPGRAVEPGSGVVGDVQAWTPRRPRRCTRRRGTSRAARRRRAQSRVAPSQRGHRCHEVCLSTRPDPGAGRGDASGGSS